MDSDWPWIHRELPASASCIRRLKTCLTVPGWDLPNGREVIKELKRGGIRLSGQREQVAPVVALGVQKHQVEIGKREPEVVGSCGFCGS